MKHRIYWLIIFIFLCMSCLACGTMMALLGDNVRFSITGNVQGGNNGRGISNVSVLLDCAGLEKSIYQDGKVETDVDGNYELSGNWELNECQINFEHEGYEHLSVMINESHLVTSEGLSRVYEVDALLELKGAK